MGECSNPDCKQETNNPKYCSKSCAAKMNNQGINRWSKKPSPFTTREPSLPCEKCGREMKLSPRKNRDGAYFVRKVCRSCLSELKDSNLTKGELKKKNSGGYYWFRGRISRHANKIYDRSGKPRKCLLCGFDIHVDICHIKDVATFPDTALVKEINHIDNLVALCPNHHVMFDKKLVVLPGTRIGTENGL